MSKLYQLSKPYQIVQILGIFLLFSLITGLFTIPERTLHVFWGLIIPLLPVTFLFSPLLWRSACPLAVANRAGNRFAPQRVMPSSNATKTSAISISLFFVLVPARHLLFNENSVALAITISVVLLLAFVMGTQFKFKSGFCNTLCPVLPVEKLYGHSPFLEVKDTRCSACSLCTAKGCLDVAPQKSISKVIGPLTRSNKWLNTPLGIFALSFPGFIIGYFTVSNGDAANLLWVYGYTGVCSVACYLVSRLIITISRLPFEQAIALWAGYSIGVYYWYASMDISEVLGLSTNATYLIRGGFLIVVMIWMIRKIKQNSKRFSPR